MAYTPALQIRDAATSRLAQVNFLNALKVEQTTRLTGPNFIGTTVDANFWTVAVTNGGKYLYLLLYIQAQLLMALRLFKVLEQVDFYLPILISLEALYGFQMLRVQLVINVNGGLLTQTMDTVFNL